MAVDTKYRIEFTLSSREDIAGMKRYILNTFKYPELGKNFTQKMKKAIRGLKTLPKAFDTTGFIYKGYDIYYKPYRTYLIFYIVNDKRKTVTILRVMKDSMDWEFIIKHWILENQ